MAGMVIDSVSEKKLRIFVVALIVGQFLCFLLGGLKAPYPSSVMSVLGTKCLDKNYPRDEWYISRGGDRCQSFFDFGDPIIQKDNITYNDIVYVFQVPIPKEGRNLDYSRWQQNLVTVLHLDVLYANDVEPDPNAAITLHVRLGYRNLNGPQSWSEYGAAVEQRTHICTIGEENKKPGYMYTCSAIPLFELGALHHDFYVLNIRLPQIMESTPNEQLNRGLGRVTNLWVAFISQNGGYTKIWVSLKTIFFPTILALMIWFWNRISRLARPPRTLEYMLLALGVGLALINCPIEYLTLCFDIPGINVVSVIFQGVFYSTLMSFWIVVTGEHRMKVSQVTPSNNLKAYKSQLGVVQGVWLCLLVFEVWERGLQIRYPFFSMWGMEFGLNLALAFIILSGICAGAYFLFLCYIFCKAFMNINSKDHAVSDQSAEGLPFRHKVILLTTLLCAAMTIVDFVLKQVSKGQWEWIENIRLEPTSAFFIGVYGMWNLYAIALFCLYAPSNNDEGIFSLPNFLRQISSQVQLKAKCCSKYGLFANDDQCIDDTVADGKSRDNLAISLKPEELVVSIV